MKARLLFICLLSALFTCHVKGQVLKPFIRGGLTNSWFDSPGATEESVFQAGPNIGVGIKVPLNKWHSLFIEPTLAAISKGDVYKADKAGGRVSFSIWYLETQLDFIYRIKIGRHWRIPFGTGLYGAYGIGSKVSATNGITWFRGIPVSTSISMFDDIIGANRWDAGWRVSTVGVEYRRFMFRWNFEVGFFPQFSSRMPHGCNQDYYGENCTMSWNIGYSF